MWRLWPYGNGTRVWKLIHSARSFLLDSAGRMEPRGVRGSSDKFPGIVKWSGERLFQIYRILPHATTSVWALSVQVDRTPANNRGG